jgi:hypothetical protein
MESMRAHFERESGSGGAWAGYNPSLARPLLNTAKFLDKESGEAAETDAGSENSSLITDSPITDSPEPRFAEEKAVSAPAATEATQTKS